MEVECILVCIYVSVIKIYNTVAKLKTKNTPETEIICQSLNCELRLFSFLIRTVFNTLDDRVSVISTRVKQRSYTQ
jgi:hypothetical protein